ncbi:polysaccharide biosynthesis family protein [Clostridioides difficile CD47]|nr:polysaccharide biosynthesis family protein [Clostridioides difficile CD47]
MKKILITGGAGFIGSNFIHYMLNKYVDYFIVNLDLLTYAGNLETLIEIQDNSNYKFVKGDISNREQVYKLFEEERFDIVVNFAAESHVDRSVENPDLFIKTNIIGTQVLLDASIKYGVKRYHKYLQTKCMVIYQLIERIYSLQNNLLSIQVLHIQLLKHQQIYW